MGAQENGNGRSNGDGDIVLDVIALKIKVERLEEEHDSHENILKRMADTDHILSERIITLEVKNKNDTTILTKLQKESGLQTKLLSAILAALVAAAIKAILHL
jgi:hypothetical protein